MSINSLLKRFNIKKSDFGKELGYTTYAGTYKALNNPKQQPQILAYLEKKLLKERGVDIGDMIDTITKNENNKK
ncbi:MAG: hypothetical protein ACFFKA_10555 [Candidatus Thorarchaeota archaeon]